MVLAADDQLEVLHTQAAVAVWELQVECCLHKGRELLAVSVDNPLVVPLEFSE